jgi:hypothetical protein
MSSSRGFLFLFFFVFSFFLTPLSRSEKDHIADMSLVESQFLLPLKAKMKNTGLLHTITSNLAMIRQFNSVLLEELSKPDAQVGKVFIRYVSPRNYAVVPSLFFLFFPFFFVFFL